MTEKKTVVLSSRRLHDEVVVTAKSSFSLTVGEIRQFLEKVDELCIPDKTDVHVCDVRSIPNNEYFWVRVIQTEHAYKPEGV